MNKFTTAQQIHIGSVAVSLLIWIGITAYCSLSDKAAFSAAMAEIVFTAKGIVFAGIGMAFPAMKAATDVPPAPTAPVPDVMVAAK
jgi:hypothetical protein